MAELITNLERAIQDAVTLRTQAVLNEEMAKAEKAVRKRLADVADQCALSVLSNYEIQSYQQHVLITVKKDTPNDR